MFTLFYNRAFTKGNQGRTRLADKSLVDWHNEPVKVFTISFVLYSRCMDKTHQIVKALLVKLFGMLDSPKLFPVKRLCYMVMELIMKTTTTTFTLNV